jgi:hypothetical protein
MTFNFLYAADLDEICFLEMWMPRNRPKFTYV